MLNFGTAVRNSLPFILRSYWLGVIAFRTTVSAFSVNSIVILFPHASIRNLGKKNLYLILHNSSPGTFYGEMMNGKRIHVFHRNIQSA